MKTYSRAELHALLKNELIGYFAEGDLDWEWYSDHYDIVEREEKEIVELQLSNGVQAYVECEVSARRYREDGDYDTAPYSSIEYIEIYVNRVEYWDGDDAIFSDNNPRISVTYKI